MVRTAACDAPFREALRRALAGAVTEAVVTGKVRDVRPYARKA